MKSGGDVKVIGYTGRVVVVGRGQYTLVGGHYGWCMEGKGHWEGGVVSGRVLGRVASESSIAKRWRTTWPKANLRDQ